MRLRIYYHTLIFILWIGIAKSRSLPQFSQSMQAPSQQFSPANAEVGVRSTVLRTQNIANMVDEFGRDRENAEFIRDVFGQDTNAADLSKAIRGSSQVVERGLSAILKFQEIFNS
nr:uncharacterized protein LOC121118711 [Lepeophtheirus salmonis]